MADHDPASSPTERTGTPGCEVGAPGTPATGSFAGPRAAPGSAPLSVEDRQWLLRLARGALLNAAGMGPAPELAETALPAALAQRRGCFVTLSRRGELRGCVGHIFPQAPLYRAVMDTARSAALRDPRFPPVQGREAHEVTIQISLLTEPRPLTCRTPEEALEQIACGTDGVVLRLEGRMATFLPEVWEQFRSKTDFMSRLSRKAGCDPQAWRREDAVVLTYRTESFGEPDATRTAVHGQ